MKKIPFIEKRAVGLHITEHKLRWVELAKTLSTVRVIDFDCEEVDGDLENALQGLIQRNNRAGKAVSVNHDPALLSSQLLGCPVADDDEILEGWLEKHTVGILENNRDRKLDIVQHTFLDIDEDRKKCFITGAEKSRIDSLYEVLETSGLVPVIITTGVLEAGYSLILNPEFVEGSSCLLRIHEGDSYLAWYSNGLLTELQPLHADELTMDDLINEVRLYFEQKKAQKAYHDLMIYVLLDGHQSEFNETELCASLQKNGFPATTIQDGLKPTGVDLPSGYAIAYGLALKQLYPALDHINFLDEDLLKNSEKSQEKQDAVVFGGVLGIILLVLILVSTLAEWNVTSGFAKVQQAAHELEDKIELIEQETDQLLLERARLTQFQELFKGRNELAPSLHVIGEIAPGNIWFTEVRVVNENNANRMILKGFSTSESGISGYMDRLEKAKEIQEVKLVIAERVSSGDFYSNETYIRSMIYRFEMDLITSSNYN